MSKTLVTVFYNPGDHYHEGQTFHLFEGEVDLATIKRRESLSHGQVVQIYEETGRNFPEDRNELFFLRYPDDAVARRWASLVEIPVIVCTYFNGEDKIPKEIRRAYPAILNHMSLQ